MSDEPIYDPEGAAQWLRDNYKTRTTRGSLAKDRHYSVGPRFFLFGRQIRYRQSDLRAWAESRMSTVYTGTSDYVRTSGMEAA